MAARNKPYDQFGPFILFKKLETDSLGELWRAGRLGGNALGPVLAVRRFTGGSRDAIAASAQHAATIVPQLTGSSFARDQVAGAIDGVPYIAHEYAGGRSLRYIVDRARGGANATPNPLPLDQAIVIAERVALSLATTGELRDGAGQRLVHGALIPQFVWISDDGDIRVAGQQFGAGVVTSLADAKVSAELGRYFSPEYRTSGTPSRASEVYSMGALFFLLVTGQEPPDAMNASAFSMAVRAATTMAGNAAIPLDIRAILDKSLTLDPASRYATIADMKQAISALANSGKYSATTFNLAFYLSNLLKKEMESEPAEREKESKVNVAPYVEALHAPRAAETPHVPAPAPFAAHAQSDEPKAKSKVPLAIAASLIAAGVGVGAWMMLGKTSAQPAAKQVATASTIPVAAPQNKLISEPIVASSSAPATTTAAVDTAAQQQAFEDAVAARLHAEMMKLQTEFNSKQPNTKTVPAPQQQTAAPVQVAAAAPQEERVSAAQLDAQRRERDAEIAAQQPAPQQTLPIAVPATQTQAAAPQLVQQQQAAPAQQTPVIREGDLVDVSALDQVPQAVRAIRPAYPPMAAAQRAEGTVILSALISERGDVLDVRVLRGDKRFGLEDSAVRALRSAKFTPPVKDGKHVRTWKPQSFIFKP
ncbi:MAG TPA: TonB family protein [Thermoanaerobaculia bacterium]|nr:TonB family protein [Thermoanaerobaculia bacterium]